MNSDILHIFDCRLQHYIHHPDHQHVFFSSLLIFVNYKLKVILIKFKKIDSCKTWVKILKVMPQSQSPFSPGKGRDTLRQKVQIFWLNIVRLNRTHLFSVFKFTSKIFQIYVLSFGKKFPANYTNFAQFTPESHE